MNNKLVSIYDPSLKVFHKEGSLLKKDNKSNRLRKLFKEKERLKSLSILLNDFNKE